MDVAYTNQQIVDYIKTGNVLAFNYFYDYYAGALYGDIKRALLNEDVAAETLKRIFVTIWRKIEEYNSKDNFFTWCLKIARKEIRKQKIEIVLHELFACQTDEYNQKRNYTSTY